MVEIETLFFSIKEIISNLNIYFVLIQILSIIAMSLAIYGSYLFVKSNFNLGAKLFIVGNSINIVLGLSVGNIWLSIAQFGLLWFTLPMVKYEDNKTFYILIISMSILLIVILPINIGFNTTIVDVLSTMCAWYGAYKMKKQDYVTMAKCWIIADIGFIYIGITEQLIGLTIQAIIFVYHGFKRLHKK